MTERELIHKWLGGESGIIEDEIANLGVPAELAKGVILRILHTCERRRPHNWPYPVDDSISLCRACMCMTHTNTGPNGESYCGKCAALKPIQNPLKPAETYTKPQISIQVNPKSHHYMEPSDG